MPIDQLVVRTAPSSLKISIDKGRRHLGPREIGNDGFNFASREKQTGFSVLDLGELFKVNEG